MVNFWVSLFLFALFTYKIISQKSSEVFRLTLIFYVVLMPFGLSLDPGRKWNFQVKLKTIQQTDQNKYNDGLSKNSLEMQLFLLSG